MSLYFDKPCRVHEHVVLAETKVAHPLPLPNPAVRSSQIGAPQKVTLVPLKKATTFNLADSETQGQGIRLSRSTSTTQTTKVLAQGRPSHQHPPVPPTQPRRSMLLLNPLHHYRTLLSTLHTAATTTPGTTTTQDAPESTLTLPSTTTWPLTFCHKRPRQRLPSRFTYPRLRDDCTPVILHGVVVAETGIFIGGRAVRFSVCNRSMEDLSTGVGRLSISERRLSSVSSRSEDSVMDGGRSPERVNVKKEAKRAEKREGEEVWTLACADGWNEDMDVMECLECLRESLKALVMMEADDQDDMVLREGERQRRRKSMKLLKSLI